MFLDCWTDKEAFKDVSVTFLYFSLCPSGVEDLSADLWVRLGAFWEGERCCHQEASHGGRRGGHRQDIAHPLRPGQVRRTQTHTGNTSRDSEKDRNMQPSTDELILKPPSDHLKWVWLIRGSLKATRNVTRWSYLDSCFSLRIKCLLLESDRSSSLPLLRIIELNGAQPPLTYKRFQTLISRLDPPEMPVETLSDSFMGRCVTPISEDHGDKYGVPSLEELGEKPNTHPCTTRC